MRKCNFIITVFASLVSINSVSYAQDEVKINLCNISTKIELHNLLKSTFNFPAYYGMNWDAFIDSMSDRVLESPVSLHIEGVNNLQNKAPREAILLRECLADVVDRYPTRLNYDFVNDDCPQ